MVDSKDPKRWIEYANMDLQTAEYLAQKMRPAPYEIICYHCQQSAEKYLKGFLIWRANVTPPYIHDLDELCKLCKEVNPNFSVVADICSELTEYGMQAKYPIEMCAEKEDAQQALRNAKSLREFMQKQAAELF